MTAKTCRVCQIRNIGTGNPGTGPGAEDASYAKSVELCRPCATEAGWENIHSDHGHDEQSQDVVSYAHDGNHDKRIAECWICFPELNLATKPARVNAGSSRVGMRLTVPVRAAAKTKADAVKAQLPTGYAVTVKTVKGRTTLTAKGAVNIVLHWDAQGRYAGGTAQATNGTAKKVRNASEALRATGV